jgi:mannose-1-phosphate guanylyltransferase
LVVNGDVVTDLDVTALLTFHREHGAEATIALHPVEDPSHFGVVPTADDGRVLAFVEKPPRDEAPTNLINAGTYVFEPRALDRIARHRSRQRGTRHVSPRSRPRGQLFAMAITPTGSTPVRRSCTLQANIDMLKGRNAQYDFHGVVDGSWRASSATIDPSARSNSVVDAGCVVGATWCSKTPCCCPGRSCKAAARSVRASSDPKP